MKFSTRFALLSLLLLIFLNAPSVTADIAIYSFNDKQWNFHYLRSTYLSDYRPSVFGLKAFLLTARPDNACEAMAPPPSPGDFIVIVTGYDCDFDIQVLNAQKAGYEAAIVHNVNSSDDDDLIAPGSAHLLKWIRIPAVLVSEETARLLRENYVHDKDPGARLVLSPDVPGVFRHPIFKVFVLGILLVCVGVYVTVSLGLIAALTLIRFAFMMVKLQLGVVAFVFMLARYILMV